MAQDRVVPRGEALRRAVRWLSEQGASSPQAIEEASRRFDLSPLEEEFLLRHFRGDAPGPGGRGEASR